MGYKKSQVEEHSDSGGLGWGTLHPAVKVKVYHLGCTTEDVVKEFGCSEEQAEKAL